MRFAFGKLKMGGSRTVRRFAWRPVRLAFGEWLWLEWYEVREIGPTPVKQSRVWMIGKPEGAA